MASQIVTASTSAAASKIASTSATSPVLIWTALNATASAPSATASATSATGTVRTSRRLCTSSGNSSEVNSMSGTTTRAPAGSAVITEPTSSDTVAPTATRVASTPTRRAKAARDASMLSPHGSQLVRPPCQSDSTACRASHAGRGGSP